MVTVSQYEMMFAVTMERATVEITLNIFAPNGKEALTSGYQQLLSDFPEIGDGDWSIEKFNKIRENVRAHLDIDNPLPYNRYISDEDFLSKRP
jgi:hypothetical protein